MFTSAVCGGEILKEQGHLSSPNYPDYYKPNKECVWKITVPDTYSVALMFQSFEVKIHHQDLTYEYILYANCIALGKRIS